VWRVRRRTGPRTRYAGRCRDAGRRAAHTERCSPRAIRRDKTDAVFGPLTNARSQGAFSTVSVCCGLRLTNVAGVSALAPLHVRPLATEHPSGSRLSRAQCRSSRRTPLTGPNQAATALPTTTTVHKLRTKSLRSSPPSLRNSVASVLSPCEVLACRNRRAIHASQRGHAVGCRGADRWVVVGRTVLAEPWSGAGFPRIGPVAGAVAIRGRGGRGSFAAPSPPSAYALRRTPAQLRAARHKGAHAVPSDSCSSVRISSSCRNSSSNWPLVRPSLSRAHSS
jgi:hypothetical protein